MSNSPACSRCGTEKTSSSLSGLCPRCLLRVGLEVESETAERESDILVALEQAVGPVPRIHLRGGFTHESDADLSQVDDVGRYELASEIARGGMGVVFKARDVDLGRNVAVKVLQERFRKSPEVVRRFVEEAQIGGQLQHPGIVPVYELGRLADGRLYIAMKLVDGRTLAELLAARTDPADALPRYLSIFEQVCQTMAYAHSCGVIHRDLKPSNIMVGNFGEVQVMDWGLAKVVGALGAAEQEGLAGEAVEIETIQTLRTGSAEDESRAGSVLGTASYMPPEQARGQFHTIDERADVFGLGGILCEILTGRPPYDSPNGDTYGDARRADLTAALGRLDACGADADLVALAKSCLAALPKHRPRDAGEVAAALTSHLAGARDRLKAAELAQAKLESLAVEERKRRILAVGLAAALVGVLVLGVGGAALVARERAARAEATAAEVSSAVDAASRLLAQARTAPRGELVRWIEASQAAERAGTLLKRAGLDAGSRRHIEDVVATIARERSLAEEDFKDRNIVERLANIHADISLHFDLRRTDQEYAEAFRDYGVDVNALSPEQAGDLLRKSAVASELANALDHWTFVRRSLFGPRPLDARRLVQVAKLADPDPWRNQLRDTLSQAVSDRGRSLDALKRLAATADAERLPEASVTRLAFALAILNNRDLSIDLLRRAQRVHPDDFWLNADLARLLSQAGHPEEAVRYYSVALAIRPKSKMALHFLAEALKASGHPEEAKAYARFLPAPPRPPHHGHGQVPAGKGR